MAYSRKTKRVIGLLAANLAAVLGIIALLLAWRLPSAEADSSVGIGRVGIGVVGAMLVAWGVYSMRRLRRFWPALDAMLDAANRVAGSEREITPIHADGELSALARAFNRMYEEVGNRERTMRETVDQLATVLGAMMEGVLAVDERQRILFANAAAGRLLDFDPHNSRGKGLLEVARNHMLHEAVTEALADRTVEDQETRRYEFDSSHSRGQILSFRPTRVPGDPCPGVVLVLQDVSELRRLEHLRQEFVANVSHELKTPLTAIKAYAETLKSGAINDPEYNVSFVENIEHEADRLHNLILDMLRLAKIESGHARFDMGEVSIKDAVAECIRRHQAAAKQKEITLINEGGEPSAQVRADKEGFRQILDNLLDNGIKYTDAGGTVRLRWKPVGDRIHIEVADTGIGIPTEAQSRVFERFYRVDKSRSRELGSTGLGLSIVKHLAHTFGGSVEVDSCVGDGSTFHVELPSG